MEPLILIALLAGAFFFMAQRSRKLQRQASDFRSSLQPGQEVMTGSGLFGTIVAVEDDIVTLETSPGVTSRWLRPAIAKAVNPPVESEELDEELVDEPVEDEVLEGDATAQTAAQESFTVPDDASSLAPDEDDRR
jgi:preprotein translocase subunit YajC